MLTTGESIHLLYNCKQHIYWRGMMVFPFVIKHPVLEFGIVILAVADIEDQVLVLVLFFKESSNL
jgi:hypothetical protein